MPHRKSQGEVRDGLRGFESPIRRCITDLH